MFSNLTINYSSVKLLQQKSSISATVGPILFITFCRNCILRYWHTCFLRSQSISTTAYSRQLHFHIGGLVPIMGPHTMNTAEVLHVSVVCHISKKRLYLEKANSGKKKEKKRKCNQRETYSKKKKKTSNIVQGPKSFVNSRNFHPLVIFEKSVGCNTHT